MREIYKVLIGVITLFIFLQGQSQSKKEIREKYNDALIKIDQFKLFEAKDLLTEITKIDATYDPAYYQLGLIEYELKNYDLAVDEFKKVIELESGKYAIDSRFKIGEISMIKKDYAGAAEMFDQILKKERNNSKATFYKGEIQFEKGNFESAVTNYSQAILLDGGDINYYYKRGLANIEIENYPKAISDLSWVINLSPDHTNAYLNRGRSYFIEGTRAEYDHHRKLFRQAHKDYDKVLELNPESEEAFYERGKTNLRLGDYAGGQRHHYIEAIYDFKHAILLNPKNTEAHYLKAYCNYKLGYEKIALSEFEEIVSIDPGFADAYYEIAVITGESNDYEKALNAFDKLVELENPVHEDTYLYRGYVYLWKQDKVKACKDFKSASDLGNIEAIQNVTELCEEVAFE